MRLRFLHMDHRAGTHRHHILYQAADRFVRLIYVDRAATFRCVMVSIISQTAVVAIIKTAVALKRPSKVCDQAPTVSVSPSIWYAPKNSTMGRNSKICFMYSSDSAR